jgi:signal transduction histidine kinase
MSNSPLNPSMWRTVEQAVLAERRRIARDLHDGLAQELAFISLRSRRLADRGEREAVDLAEAADRALYEASTAIEQLASEADQPLHQAIAETAERLTSRSDATLELDIDPAAESTPERREGLLRILSEAVWNGLRHGNATRIAVTLSGHPGLRLRVTDNGAGFDPDVRAAKGGSFGLVSMTERAQSLGGEVRLNSWPGVGTEVEVSLP